MALAAPSRTLHTSGLRSQRGASHRILQLIEEGRAIPVLSVPLILEYEDVLKREAGALDLTAAEADKVLDDLSAAGEPSDPLHLAPSPSGPKR
jgi:hypothetical protein